MSNDVYVFDKCAHRTSGIKKTTEAWNKQKKDCDMVSLFQQLPGDEM